MRHQQFAMSEAQALAVFQRVGLLRICAVGPSGPIARTFDGAVVDGTLCFHGGDHGEKLEILGREVVASADETVAHLPSWFFDERRACPATTYYRSAQVRGRVERVVDRERKAVILQALMERLQPEGHYQVITADDRLYAGVLDKLLVASIVPTTIVGRNKLGQHKGERTIVRALEGLWRRGDPGDLRAIREIRAAHPARPTPEWMRGPQDTVLQVAPDARELSGAVDLVLDQYWNEGVSRAQIEAAHRASQAWIVLCTPSGEVVATARAVTDDAKMAMVFDVAVAAQARGRGYGGALMHALLDHPRVRGARRVLLQTRDAHGFYAKHGFAVHTARHDTLLRAGER